MADSHRAPRLGPAILAVAILAVLVGAIGFAASDQAVRISRDAAVLRHSERVLGDSAGLRSNIGIMLVLASAQSAGLAVERPPSEARDAALAYFDELLVAVEELEAEGVGDLAPLVDEVEGSLGFVTAAMASPELADERARERFLPALEALNDAVVQIANTATSRIEAESGSAGRAAFVSSLTVGLLIPAIAVAIVRSVVRRRSDHDLLVSELRAERELADARDDLIKGLSHELRTPLTGIFGFAEALRDESAAGPVDEMFVREASETIYREAGELRRMVDDLLVAARAEVGDLEYRFDDVEARDQVIMALEPFHKRGDEITVELDPASIRTDRLRFQHAVRNVVANAIEHGGVDVAVRGHVIGSAYRLSVSDGGAGIPPEMSERIFERFANHDSVTAGRSLGMGLAVAQTLMRGMGGIIEHRRMDDRTVFAFEIPLSPHHRPRERQVAASGH